MQINIKTSGENQAIVTQLTKKLTGGTKENVIARIALGYSLSTGKRFTQQEFSAYDSQLERNTKTIFCLMGSIEISTLP